MFTGQQDEKMEVEDTEVLTEEQVKKMVISSEGEDEDVVHDKAAAEGAEHPKSVAEEKSVFTCQQDEKMETEDSENLTEDELKKLTILSDSEDEDVVIDETAAAHPKKPRTHFCSVSEIADKIAHPGESVDSAKSRALCFSHVLKGRYSVDLNDDKELQEWRQKLEAKLSKAGGLSPEGEDSKKTFLDVNECQTRKRAHSVMARVDVGNFLKRRHTMQALPDEEEALKAKALRYKEEYLQNRKNQKIPELREMDEEESKLLDKAIAHLIDIERVCASKVKVTAGGRVPHNSICEGSSSKLNTLSSIREVPEEHNLHEPRPKGIRKRGRAVLRRIRKFFGRGHRNGD